MGAVQLLILELKLPLVRRLDVTHVPEPQLNGQLFTVTVTVEVMVLLFASVTDTVYVVVTIGVTETLEDDPAPVSYTHLTLIICSYVSVYIRN